MSVRGIGWYAGAFIALIVSAALIGVAAASFLASLTPLYMSVACSVAAVAFGVVAAVRARPGDASLDDRRGPAAPDDSVDADEPADAAAPADATGDGE